MATIYVEGSQGWYWWYWSEAVFHKCYTYNYSWRKQANFASCKMCSISKSYYVTNNRGRENPAKCPLNPYLNYKTFVFNATTSLICIYMNSKACKWNMMSMFPTLSKLEDIKEHWGKTAYWKTFLITHILEAGRAVSSSFSSLSIMPLYFLPLILVRLAAKAISWLLCLLMVLNLSGTTCSVYDFPGKFLLSFGSACNCGNQYATYSPSGSYVCACNFSILGIGYVSIQKYVSLYVRRFWKFPYLYLCFPINSTHFYIYKIVLNFSIRLSIQIL